MTIPSAWPDGRLGAVSLTFDDGAASQLRRAVPALNEAGLQGTFYLNPRGEDWEARLAPWIAVADAGHEIGNHTLTHPCTRGFADRLDVPCLERMTLADIESDILEAERRLRAVIPHHDRRSFCYPCYFSYVGEGAERRSYVPVVAKHFVAGRTKGERANHPLTSDLHDLSSWPAERMSGAELVGLAERAPAAGRWTVLTFHGINEGHLSVAAGDLQELIDHLHRHRQRIWTAPVATVAQQILGWRREIGKLDPADRRG
jgi:peptidoglycan-N-acetylglucosamine deacetylase